MLKCCVCQLPGQMSAVLADKKLQFFVAVSGDLSVSTRLENWLQHALYEGSTDAACSYL